MPATPKSSIDERQTKVQALIGRMAEGVGSVTADADSWRDALERQARFHTYSFGNQVLIAIQRPDVTKVAGYRTWQKHGRQVRKGEKGIAILAPVTVRKTRTKDDGTEEAFWVLVGFRIEYVFDISQTDPIPGKAQAEPEPIAWAVGEAWLALVRYAESQGLTVRVEPTGSVNTEGYYRPATRSIVVSPALEGVAKVKVLAHEEAEGQAA